MLQRRSYLPLVLALSVLSLAGCGRGATTASLVTAPAAKGAAPSVRAEATKVTPSVSLSRGEAVSAGPEALPDEVIVRFKNETRELPGATRLRDLPLRGTAVYKVNKAGYALQAAEEWEEAADIDYIEPNYVYHAVATPNDPRWADSWGVGAINAPNLWLLTQGEGVKVAVIDTGVDAGHPDLAGRVLPGYDLVNDDGDATDDHGHGTHVAGTIAALVNNGIDVGGVAPGAKIIPIKVLNASGQGYNADIANGVLEAANRGAKIINLSLGGTDNSETLRRAIADVQARGVVVVAAAGNDGVSTPFYPAANDGVIAVAAVDSARRKADFSNYGDYIDIAAPGVNIGSTRKGGGVATMSGTSMASPHVAGACALLVAQFPNLKAGHLLRLMQVGGQATSGFTGNAPKALNVEEAFVHYPTLDLQAPSVVTGLVAAAGAPGEVNLTWSPAADNSGSVSYRVFRDGEAAGTTSTPGYTDRGVGKRAVYKVVAYDGDGNEAAPSAAVEADPGQASSKILDLKVTKRASSELTFSWRTAEPMRCYVQWGTDAALGNGTGWETTPTLEHTYTLKSLKRFKNYHYRVVAATNDSQLHYTNTLKARTKLWWLFAVE